MNRAFLGSLGQGHTSSRVAPNPLEDLAVAILCDDRTIANSYDSGMAGGSTLVPTSPE